MPREPPPRDAPALPAWLGAEMASVADALAPFQLVVPEGQRIGLLVHEAMTLMGRLAPPSAPPAALDPSRAPLLVPFARLPLLDDPAAARRLLDAPPAALEVIRAGRGLVVLDCANEGRGLYRPHVANVHAALDAAGIPPERAVWVQQNRLLAQHYRQACAAEGRAPVHVVVGHSHAAGLWRRVMLGGRGVNWRYGFAVAGDGPRPHRWVCLNYNLRPHRALLVAWLQERPEPGFLSFSATRETHVRLTRQALLNRSAALAPDDPGRARAAVARLLDSGLHHGSDIDGFAHPHERVYSLPVEAVAGAELFIVTETEMDGPGMLRWTEKMLKALASGLPFVVFGNSGVVAALAGLGFDTLDDLVDHGYDAEADPPRRFAAARAAVARFLARPPGFTAAELERLRAAADHNRAVFAEALLRDALVVPMRQILALAAR